MKKIFIFNLILSITFFMINAQSFEDLAQTPLMGWNSWNKFGCDVNENLIREMADAMVSSGMREVWVKFLKNDELAVCFLNRSDLPWKENYNWGRMNIYHLRKAVRSKKMAYVIRDLWGHKDLKTTEKPLKLNIPTHGRVNGEISAR